jgi:hypothetical protein
MINNNEEPIYSALDGKPPCGGYAQWTYYGDCEGQTWDTYSQPGNVYTNYCTGYSSIVYGGETLYTPCVPIFPDFYPEDRHNGGPTTTTGCN